MTKPKTEGQRLLALARLNLEWAERMFSESATPEAVDIDRLVDQIRTALATRQAEIRQVAPALSDHATAVDRLLKKP